MKKVLQATRNNKEIEYLQAENGAHLDIGA